MSITNSTMDLSQQHFLRIKDLLYRTCGINLKPGKENLVKNRLTSRLRALHLTDFDTYLRYIEEESNREELTSLIDVMTTNKTSFFREIPHFEYISNYLIPEWTTNSRPLSIWSAGCSTGEEPYSLAMHLRENFEYSSKVRILATDLSDTVLKTARQGFYKDNLLEDVPLSYKRKYLTPIPAEGGHQVNAQTQGLVHFATLNLMGNWPMQGPFDLILCRNVMIYFDKATQENLVNRFWRLLAPGGHLFIGHSESLSGVENPFQYVQPAIYRR